MAPLKNALIRCIDKPRGWLKRGEKNYFDDSRFRIWASWVASSDGDHYTMPPPSIIFFRIQLVKEESNLPRAESRVQIDFFKREFKTLILALAFIHMFTFVNKKLL